MEKENITEVLSLINEINAQAWLLVVVKTLPHDKLTRVVLWLYWAIWHVKRKVVHEDVIKSSLSTHCFRERFVAGLEMTKPFPSRRAGGQPTLASRWIPPTPGFIKVAGLFI